VNNSEKNDPSLCSTEGVCLPDSISLVMKTVKFFLPHLGYTNKPSLLSYNLKYEKYILDG
jgi:hypothetical protein